MAKLKLGAGVVGGIFVVGLVKGGDEDAEGTSGSKSQGRQQPEPPPVPGKPVMAPLATALGSIVGAGVLGLGGVVYHQRIGDKHARHSINVAQNGVRQLTRERAEEQLQRRIAEREALGTTGAPAADLVDESVPSYLRPGADGGESTIAAAEEIARRDELVRTAQREARVAGRKARISNITTTISDTPLTGVRARHAAIWTGAVGLAALGAYMLYTSGSNLIHNIKN